MPEAKKKLFDPIWAGITFPLDPTKSSASRANENVFIGIYFVKTTKFFIYLHASCAP